MRTYALLSVLLFLYAYTGVAQNSLMRYELVKMSDAVNTFRHEAAPVITPDGNTLYFFVDNHPENTFGTEGSQDIWVSRKDADGNWSKAEHLGRPFNIHPFNQLFTAFEDGSMFIKGGSRKGEKGFSMVYGGNLQELEVTDFKKMNQGRFYGATMSADKKHMIIYFSEKPNSIHSDLYVSHAMPDGTWSRPKMLPLSSPQDDVAPFIHPNQKEMYFASARQAPGRQGLTDIYKTTRLDDTWEKWSTPENVGKPINTNGEDFYFTIDRSGTIITSKSNKALEGAQLDLYMLVPKQININLVGVVYNEKDNNPVPARIEVRMESREPIALQASHDGKFETRFPEVTEYMVTATAQGFEAGIESFTVPMLYNDTTLNISIPLKPLAKEIYIAGTVFDNKTQTPINANLKLTRKGVDGRPMVINTNDGAYSQRIPGPGWYLITVSAEGYLNAADSVNVESEDLSPYLKDLFLQPIEVGVTVRLKNIYFDFDRTTLRPESYAELDKVVQFLKENPSVEIEIAGHTDDKGSDTYNLNLSQGRSQSVVDYIVSQGIESYRLTAQGYGESKPIDTNATPEGQANNRRVEFTILKK